MILSNIILAGIYGGIVSTICGILMKVTGFTSMDMSAYAGCLMTKKASGIQPFIAEMFLHFTAAIGLAFAYFLIFKLFTISGWKYGLLVGIFHWLFTGSMLPFMDKSNYCVQNKIIAPMGLYVNNYGINGFLAYLLNHLAFGATVGYFLIV